VNRAARRCVQLAMKRSIVLLLAAVAISACGGAAYGVNASAPAKAGKAASVSLRTTKLGRILVDSRGRTLYLFAKDTGSKSTCSGACAAGWPPLVTTGRAHAGAGVPARKLGTTRRANGSRQVTYAGHPLYRFAGDTKAGQTNGQGQSAFGARWYAVRASGARAVTPKPVGTPPPYNGGY
jgi:predicted lipoprotein with Yx(FWY)xxD motif